MGLFKKRDVGNVQQFKNVEIDFNPQIPPLKKEKDKTKIDVRYSLISPFAFAHIYFVEDIECNGSETPIYIVHRTFRNIKTNLAFHDMDSLTSFVEKLAQRAGKYVSYATPILDGSLPDGSRINATYTQDITTRGPT